MTPASLQTEPREDQRHTFTLESCKPGYIPLQYIFYVANFSSLSLLVAIQPLLHACLSLHDSPDQAAHYHILPASHHSIIAPYSSIARPGSTLSHSPCQSPLHHCSILIYSSARQHIITFSPPLTIPPLLCTHL